MTAALTLLYLFVPAFVANSTPVIVKNLPVLCSWNTPVHARWFGTNKTYRGFLCGIALGMAASLLQYALRDVPVLQGITLLHETPGKSALVGFLLGFGALFGDAVESFVKRRMGLPPGRALPFWDGADYIIGGLVLLAPLYVVPLQGMFFLLVAGPLLSLASNMLAYAFGMKDVWY